MKSTATVKLQKWLTARAKHSLTAVGATLPRKRVQQLSAVANYVSLGHWMTAHDFVFPERVLGREAVFDVVARQIADRHVLYLEFGVYYGDSMRYWSRRLTHPKTQLHGFDSFAGLPEDGGIWHQGQFDVRGAVPQIADPRVRFFPGWFDRVLPEYTLPDHDVLTINMDADLYSSTISVLRSLRPYFKPGTFIYFDDLCQLEHEPRAFHEFMVSTGLRFRPVVASVSLGEAFFECVGSQTGSM